MADRYCRNCGHELAQDDRFCPNCGTHVHEAAHVPTPEADRPVPRIPPAAERTAWQRIRYGTLDAPQQTEAPPRSRSTASKLLFGRAGLFVVLILFVGCLAVLEGGGGGGNGGGGEGADRAEQEQEKQEQAVRENRGDQRQQDEQGPRARIGQTVKVGDVAWKVTDAKQATELKAPYTDKKQGNFVVVDFVFTNNGTEAVTLDSASLALLDGEGRTFEPDPDASSYIDPQKTIFLENVNPGVTQEGEVIFTVAPDATDFTLQAGDTVLFTDKNAHVKLGF